MDTTTQAPDWTLFGLSFLLQLLLLIFCPCLRVILILGLGDKIMQKICTLCKWQLRKEADKSHEKEGNEEAKRSSSSTQQQFTNAELESRTNWGFVREGLHRPDLHGMDIYEIKVLDFLEHDTSSSLLGIFGKHGVGKSTLLRLITSNHLFHNSFEYIFCLEEQYDGCTVGAFQNVIAEDIGLRRWPQMSDALFANVICSHLRDKTFLVLLDDLRDGIDLATIGLPMPLGRRQKVVFTTRDQAICVKMGCAGNSIQMQCLGEDDAWKLFRYYVGNEIIDADLEIEDIAKQMVAKSEAKKAKKRDKKARRRGGDFGHAIVHVTPKSHKKLNLVPAGLSRPDIHGMVNDEMNVLQFLEHGTTAMLGISGKRGMGKSTLLNLVHTSITSHGSPFSFVFFAEAGIGFTSGMLRRVLATYIGVGPTPAVPSVNLISSFLQCESFILLLDDVRASFDLAAAGLPMPLGPRQKVVFTTRDESICTDMGSSGNNIRMGPLAEDVAWDLFKYYVGSEIIDADLEIEDIAKEMVAECRGIPSAICTIGRSMADETDVRHWWVAYEMLKVKRPPLHEIGEMDDEGYPRLDFFEDALGDPFLCTYVMSE